MTALKEGPLPEPEVLIEEARRRHRRRRAALGGLFTALVIAAGAFWIMSGGGPPSTAQPIGHGGASRVPSGSWHELSTSAAGIARGAQIISVVQYHGELVATGTLCVVSKLSSGCYPHENPVVWVSRTGANWTKVFAAKPFADQDYGRERLIATSDAVFLLNHAQHSDITHVFSDDNSELWRSTNLHNWRPVALPKAFSHDGTVLSASGSGDKLILGGRTSAWSTTNGSTWERMNTPAHRHLLALGISSHGKTLLANGAFESADPNTAPRDLVWRSTNDGTSWSQINLPNSGRGDFQILAGRDGLLIGRPIQPAHPGVYSWTPKSQAWQRVHLPGIAETKPQDPTAAVALYALANGLLAVQNHPEGDVFANGHVFVNNGRASQSMWWSANGRFWAPVKLSEQLPTGYSPSVIVAIGNTLMAVEQKASGGRGTIAGSLPTGATTFWRLTISVPHTK